MNNKLVAHRITSTSRAKESGVALLTVLALLSIFAVVLAGFTYTIRMEENTLQQYVAGVNVQESTEAAIQGALAQLARDLDPDKSHYLLGRSQPKYTSLLDPWAVGYAGRVGNNVTYDARSHMLDVRPSKVFERKGLRFIPTPIPLGVDEDPPGDVTGMRGVMRKGQGDKMPGLGGVDDDLDGEVDAGTSSNVYANDDDEDYRIDEDGLDARRDNGYFPAGTGYDIDGDRLGVFDESAKINVNFAGNNLGVGNSQVYNLGVTASELDLPLFLYNRIVRGNFGSSTAETLAAGIVNYRYGDVANGGGIAKQPGLDNKDDDNNGDPQIVKVQKYSTAFNDLTQFEGQPYVVVGNGYDDDGDSLMNEEDERYIGPSTENSSGSPLTKAFDHDNAENYRPGDKIDNDGDGFIDENNEGTDDPGEFNVFQPKGDDRPYSTIEDLRMVGILRANNTIKPTFFEMLRDEVTIYSQSDEISGPLSAKYSEIAKINPNLSSNWLATDVWTLSKPTANRADFQYGPKIHIEDLLSLQVDNDGDWQSEAESAINEKDDDGDGLVDEPSDDWDGNNYASGDFDGFGEPDVGAPAFDTGSDFDRDYGSQDKLSPSGNRVYQSQRILGWDDDIKGSDFSPRRWDAVTLDEKYNDIIYGMVIEGNGQDDDGDLLVDDTGDFNGDSYLSYDPEWHVSEDAWGDLSADGYPGLGADPEADEDSREGRIVKEPDVTDALLISSLADDDYDGYADFYDPQVLAAMFAPEWDGVDNDSDGEVDEIGERYIAMFDDDEDGRYDEDPPEFQIALNLIDYIDAWGPCPVSEDEDVKSVLGRSKDDAVLSDPVTIREFTLYTTRQRAFRMHSRLFAGPNSSAQDSREFAEQMRFLLPNPAQIGMPVKFEGVEAIRINEVMAKPVIRLEAEEVLDSIQFNDTDPANPYPTIITYSPASFKLESGAGDDGKFMVSSIFDSNWGPVAAHADGNGPSLPGFSYLPEGFQNTFNPILPIVNMDSMAPAFIFGVTNVSTPSQAQTTLVGTQPVEKASWVFNNIPSGVYDVVLYLNPNHKYRPEVMYEFNGEEITFKSDTTVGDILPDTGPFADPELSEIIRRDTAVIPIYNNESFGLDYRLTAYPLADNLDTISTTQRVQVRNDGVLTVDITAGEPFGGPGSGNYYETSFDRIELVNSSVQYTELVNLTTEDINLSGWQVNTPYGHYIIPDDTIIGRMAPSYEDDDGRDIKENIGLPGNGVPFEPLLTEKKLRDPGGIISSLDLLLEDNKLLLANNKNALISFIKDNYPDVPDIANRVVMPVIAQNESMLIQASLPSSNNPEGAGPLDRAQFGDLRFRLVDMQDDILTHNPKDKYVTLYDPAGGYIDSFKYRTTFNNVIVDFAENGPGYDLLALPGYRGMESFERADPTHFDTKMKVANGTVRGERTVPSSIKLDVDDAIVFDLDPTADFQRTQIGGYILASKGSDTDEQNPDLRLPRFVDRTSFPENDAHWNGWDFIGDFYQYPHEMSSASQFARFVDTNTFAREAVTPENGKNRFYSMIGGFENMADVRSANQIRYTAFTWRMGVRELIRSGYDPDVDDQLTVRMIGRKAISPQDETFEIDLPVGEVLVNPAVVTMDPGLNDIDDKPKREIANAANKNYLYGVHRPVFTKLRNGDTAFSIDLRERFRDLSQDLSGSSLEEAKIDITIIMRKSTRDQGFLTNNSTVTVLTRPDLAQITLPMDPTDNGDYLSGAGVYVGNMGDDNYFFKGIELFGRGRKGDTDTDETIARRALLAGTPGRDNTGYVPAYPRRRLDLGGQQRDELDVIDNTAYVKNGPLATVGEISRLFTGNRFETINTPIIPQRVEDIATAIRNRVLSTPDIVDRIGGNAPEFRKMLVQRERLDQWENQYTQIYNMVTTAKNGIVPGSININTAPREVLVALPFCPLDSPGRLKKLELRHKFNTICADYIIEGRQPGGHDMHFGIHNLDDDDFLNRIGFSRTMVDTMSEYKMRTVGRDYLAFKNFKDIESERFDRMDINIKNVEGNNASNIRSSVYLTTEVSDSDDGPFTDTGTLLSQIMHLRRRDRFADLVRVPYDRTLDLQVDYPGDLRERLNDATNDPLTTEEMEAIMNRISNLITVRSRAFSIITRGRIFDSEGNITAQRKLEAIYQR